YGFLAEAIQTALFQCPERKQLILFATPSFSDREPLHLASGAQTRTVKSARYRVKRRSAGSISAFETKISGGSQPMAKLPGRYSEFRKEFPAITRAYDEISSLTASAGPLDEKMVQLVRLGMAIGSGQEGAVILTRAGHWKRAPGMTRSATWVCWR